MGTSSYLTLFLCVVFPIYLAFSTSAWVSDVGPLFSPLSQRVKAFHIALMSPLAETAEHVHTAKSGTKKNHFSSLPDGLAHSINSLEQYAFLAEDVLQRKHARYVKQTPTQKTISNKLGYPAHFENARKGIDVNAHFVQQVAQMARNQYRTGSIALGDEDDAEFGLVSQLFGHLVRDWSRQGAEERQATFPPIINGLEQHFGSHENAKGKKVLVPGSGLGRLASDIADLGTSIFHLHPLKGAI